MSGIVDTLRREGIFEFPVPLLSFAEALRVHLAIAPAFTGHVIPQGDGIERSFDHAMRHPLPHVTHRLSDILSTPCLFDFVIANHPLAADYFGAEPSLYSVNAFWKKPDGPAGWHHDTDDGPHQLVCFMYGTDVNEDAGGVHAYVTGSHLWDREKLKPWHNVQEDVSGPLPADWPVRRIVGPAGTVFLTDTRGLHNGFPPTTEPRLLLWSRWCVKTPKAYINDETKPVSWREICLEPARYSDEMKQRTQLIVDWS